MTRCIGRRTSEAKADRRWSFTVYGAFQCKMAPLADGNLCADCCARRARDAKGSTEASNWHGVVTDMNSMPAWSHVAGSAWCLSGKPKWLGVARPKAVRQVYVPAVAAAPVTAVAAAVAEVEVEEGGELTIIGGEIYMVRHGNVYEYDVLTERSGDFVGRLTAEDTIDPDGEEETADPADPAPAPAPPAPAPPAAKAPAKAPLMGPWETAAKKMAETFAAAAAAAQGAVEKAAKDTAEKKAARTCLLGPGGARTTEMAQLKEQLAAANKELAVLRAFAEKVRGSLPV